MQNRWHPAISSRNIQFIVCSQNNWKNVSNTIKDMFFSNSTTSVRAERTRRRRLIFMYTLPLYNNAQRCDSCLKQLRTSYQFPKILLRIIQVCSETSLRQTFRYLYLLACAGDLHFQLCCRCRQQTSVIKFVGTSINVNGMQRITGAAAEL